MAGIQANWMQLDRTSPFISLMLQRLDERNLRGRSQAINRTIDVHTVLRKAIDADHSTWGERFQIRSSQAPCFNADTW